VIRYEVVDMFAEAPFAGSPLGVVPDAADLTSDAMASVARAIDTPETAFVLPPSDSYATYRVRVFTPAGETPHGAHSAAGTAATLVRLGRFPAGRLVQECGSARHRVTATVTGATLLAEGPARLLDLDPAPLLAAAGLTAADLAGPPRSAGYRTGFAFLPVRPGAVRAARPDPRRFRDDLPALCVVSWDGSRHTATTRVFAPGFGIPEDPACGPVAAALGVWLVGEDLAATDGTQDYTVRQDAGPGRSSRFTCSVTVAGGQAVTGTACGPVVPVARGLLGHDHRPLS